MHLPGISIGSPGSEDREGRQFCAGTLLHSWGEDWEMCNKHQKKSEVVLPDSKASMAIRFPGRKWVFESVQASQVHGISKEDNW